MKQRIVILGSASGMPSAQRSSSSFILETDSQSYLFDAGEGTSTSILRYNIDYDKINTIFISHMHPDHCVGLFSLIQMDVSFKQGKKPGDIPSRGIDHRCKEFFKYIISFS